MDDRTNTIAGWVLGAGIVALGVTIVTGEMFEGERPEKMGYPIEGVVEEGAGATDAEQPIAFYMAAADPAKGAQVFKKCAACHTDAQGGPNGLGPNLWAVVGKPIAHLGGAFAYSDVLKSHGGNWDFETLSQWLKSPRAFAPGTKMTFAGLSKPEDRADIIAYLNSQGSNLPLPPPPAADTPAEVAAENADQNAAGDKGEDEPVMTEAQAIKGDRIGGEGAPSVAGTSAQERH